MFKKKKCKDCGEKISEEYNFCPYCRSPLDWANGDFGILGRNDFTGKEEIKLPMGINLLFNSLVKNLNNQFQNLDQETKKSFKEPKVRKGGISIRIATSGDKPPEINVKSFGNLPEFQEQKEQTEKISKNLKGLPSTNSKKFAGLPKKEPTTEIRRLSNRVVYEIKMPGVKSIKDISIIQLENSIEIKALAKDKVFYKIIPINLPIKDYNLSKGKLVLELDAKE